MPRRRSKNPGRRDAREAPFYKPFGGLARQIKTVARSTAPPPRPSGAPTRAPVAGGRDAHRDHAGPDQGESDDGSSFLREMADVQPLRSDRRVDAPPPALRWRPAPISEEAEALAALSDLASGVGEFDLSDSAEYIEGAVVGLDPRILRRLRRGEFAYQAYLDLHGMTAAPARAAVESFIAASLSAGRRCVLIVHGRGHNSKDRVPVLKERLKSWLARGRIGRAVLAFTSARPADGGAGALYVLLRRRRGAKERIAVYEGAKRE